MRKFLSLLATALLLQFSLFANDYVKAWEALRNNDRKAAAALLDKAINDPSTAADAYLTYIYLQVFNGKDPNQSQFEAKVLNNVKDKNPYLYALWFNPYVLGAYGKKTLEPQLNLLEKLFKSNDINGSLKSAAHYVRGMHYLNSNDFDKAKQDWLEIGSIGNWQLVGPFENLSGTGFYKNYGPLEHPDAAANFKSLNNADIQWFLPAKTNEDAWLFLQSHIPNATAITYAQTFVYSPEDKKVVLNAGVNGSIKVWVNDGLNISESNERVTELDYYKSYCQLRKGYNRILVQVGYTDNSIPNFIIRLTDESGKAVSGLTTKTTAQTYTKDVSNAPVSQIRHFAEEFFEARIKSDPENFINYILLTQVYLRNKNTFEARKTIQAALKRDPDNSLLRFELVQCLIKDQSRTLLSQEIEWFKEKDPKCFMAYELNIDRLINEEKYDEAAILLKEQTDSFGETEESINSNIRILGAQKKMEEAIKAIQSAYDRYPENISFVNMMFNLKKSAYKDNSGAIAVYEKYMNRNFNYGIFKSLGEEYIDQGKKEKGNMVMNRLQELFPYDAEFMAGRVKYFFEQQDYKKALEYCNICLNLAPYVASYWDNKAIVQLQLGDEQAAATSYRKGLFYDSKRYESRAKLRNIEKKAELFKNFPETDFYDLIKKSTSRALSQDHNYSYLMDEKFVIVHAEGAVEEYVNMVIRINTEKGIDDWKESYIPYNDYTQTLLIEKAEVVKKNGTKLTAEKNGNEFVFTTLEVGDAIIIKYRLQNFSRGRLAREFWDRYNFNSFNPSDMSRYCLLIDKKVAHDFRFENSTQQPVIKDLDDYKLYTWQVAGQDPVKDEPYMPSLNDVGATLHISTVKSWNDIAQWYSDISYSNITDDYELKEVYKEIFPGTEKLSETAKARKIYDYIESNIRYSSVSFRQGAYVPQKPSVTINTRLGDCKDLSSLFVSLAGMAGLKANMVLVDTKDNGMKEMVLPSLEFNHCIVLLKADAKEYYIELTDNDLPFASLPTTVPGSSSLIIPQQTEKGMVSNLQLIQASQRTSDRIKRNVNINLSGNDLKLQVEVKKQGALTSGIRSQYTDLSEEKMLDEMQESVSGSFKNPVKMETVSFKDLDKLGDSISYKYACTVQNEVVEVGDISMFKVPFGEVVATIDNFSKDTRKFPIEYWRYEDVDDYETSVTIKIPAGKNLVEVPKAQNFTFKKNTYSIKYTKTADNRLIITRKANLIRENIQPADYAAFKEFLNSIVKTEAKYVAFK